LTLQDGVGFMLCEVLLEATKVTFDANAFILVTTNEGATINNTHWLSIRLYMVQGWKIVTILLCVEIIRVFVTFDNIFFLRVKYFLIFVV